tara:strand:- start:222 stop:512 length:291 start_codon:yes stop_codon:yes gene_type:complete
MAVYVGGSELSSGTTLQSDWRTVGSYVLAMQPYQGHIANGTATASTSYRLWTANVSGSYNNTNSTQNVTSGTWRACSYTHGSGYLESNVGLFQRLS